MDKRMCANGARLSRNHLRARESGERESERKKQEGGRESEGGRVGERARKGGREEGRGREGFYFRKKKPFF